MAKFNMIIFILISSLMLMGANVESTLINNVVKFRVYVHLDKSGPNANSYEVARANITANSPTSFGLVTVGDALITSGPDMNTGTTLGRAQGFTVYPGLTELVQLVTVDFVFTEGKYRGSTLTAVGRLNQEISIVGGTGFFQLARGYISSSIYSNDPTIGRLVIVYAFFVYLN